MASFLARLALTAGVTLTIAALVGTTPSSASAPDDITMLQCVQGGGRPIGPPGATACWGGTYSGQKVIG
ncbi:hypothetical protein [Actinomadura harenae]|uniref:Uncharacterized protein n=1 Tax=Actinomadura harenae TaxID=2483351 RepID=A0A3M2MED3_9ACTN|nr:hypothetical protein [Actinomadura harenae]RMI47360.1 hypothetical protein EBO15_02240 [Actinomadura harenae]